MWAGTSISLCFLIFRIFVRLKSFHKVYADDFLVSLAWLMILASSIIWQTQQSHMYTQFRLAAGRVEPTPEVLAGERSFLYAEFAIEVLFSLTLWAVKFSFLVFFRRLGSSVRGQIVWWWCVMVFTVAALVTIIGTLDYQCELRSLGYIFSMRSLLYKTQRANRLAAQCSDPSNIGFQWAVIAYHVSMDIITDVLRKFFIQSVVHD